MYRAIVFCVIFFSINISLFGSNEKDADGRYIISQSDAPTACASSNPKFVIQYGTVCADLSKTKVTFYKFMPGGNSTKPCELRIEMGSYFTVTEITSTNIKFEFDPLYKIQYNNYYGTDDQDIYMDITCGGDCNSSDRITVNAKLIGKRQSRISAFSVSSLLDIEDCSISKYFDHVNISLTQPGKACISGDKYILLQTNYPYAGIENANEVRTLECNGGSFPANPFSITLPAGKSYYWISEVHNCESWIIGSDGTPSNDPFELPFVQEINVPGEPEACKPETPACVSDVLTDVILTKSTDNVPIDKTAGAGGIYNFKVENNQSYTLNLVGLTQPGQDYSFVSSDISAITCSNCVNQLGGLLPPLVEQYTVKVNLKPGILIGSYSVQLTPQSMRNVCCLNTTGCTSNNCNIYQCPSLPTINFFVGGSDVVLPTDKCIVYLPDKIKEYRQPSTDYPQVENDPSYDFVLNNFDWVVSSEKSIIVNPGLVLKAGATLVLQRATSANPVNTDDPGKDANWIEASSFDDRGNLMSNSKVYYDDFENPIQIQTKELANGSLLVSQMFYDSQGRQSIATLPAVAEINTNTTSTDPNCPNESIVTGQDINFRYRDNTDVDWCFVRKNSDGTAYKVGDLDPDPYQGTPELPISSVRGVKSISLGWYYSNFNIASADIEPTTPTTSYPFLRTLYKNDGTNEVKSIIPPGDIYRATSGYQHVSVSQIDKVDQTSGGIDATILQNYLLARTAANLGTNSLSDIVSYLYKQTITDENGNISIIYFDKTDKAIITIADKNNYTSTTSYQLYDNQGRLIILLSPKSVQAYLLSSSDFSTINKRKFIYDFDGSLIQVDDNDEGTTKFIWRNDGQIKFSQDAKQRNLGGTRYSYTNYDKAGRIVESGEYTNGTVSFEAGGVLDNLSTYESIIEGANASGDMTGATKADITNVYYDGRENLLDVTSYRSPFTQDFIRGRVSSTARFSDISTRVSQSWYSYDERGRLKRMDQYLNALGASKTIEYKYNPQGNVMEVAYQRGQSDNFFHYYDYYPDGKLKNVYAGTTAPTYTYGAVADINDNGIGDITNRSSLTLLAEYVYLRHGPLKQINYMHPNGADVVQSIDYLYTIEGWLKAINDPTKGSTSTDKFAMSLEYYTGDYAKNGVYSVQTDAPNVNKFGGLVRATTWYNQNFSNTQQAFKYAYDAKNQLTAATYGTVTAGTTNGTFTPGAGNYNESFSYDPNGNTTGITRFGNSSTDKLHDISILYNTASNRINNTTGSYLTDYQYNAKGQIVSYNNKAITYDVYDKTTSYDGIQYTYDDRGNRITSGDHDVSVYDNSGNQIAHYENTTSNATFTISDFNLYGSTRIGRVRNPTGSIFWTADFSKLIPGYYDYELHDHLGNVRVLITPHYYSFNPLSTTFTLQAESSSGTDYYAYGSPMPDRNTQSTPTYKYGYQGQNADKAEGDLYHFEARDYDPIVGRWLNTDKANQFYSPYLGMGNNPIIAIDPDGLKVVFAPGSSESFIRNYNIAKNYLIANGAGDLISKLEQSSVIYTIKEAKMDADFAWKTKTIRWDPHMAVFTRLYEMLSPASVLNHEIDHALGSENMEYYLMTRISHKDYTDLEERRVITGSEVQTAHQLNEVGLTNSARYDHYGTFIRVDSPISNRDPSEVVIIGKK